MNARVPTDLRLHVSHAYVAANAVILADRGFSHARTLVALGMEAETWENAAGRISIDHFLSLLNTASHALADPNLALRVGHAFRVATFAQTGKLYGYCEDLTQVITLNGRYQRLAIDAGKIDQYREGETHYMRFSPYYRDPIRYRPISDIIMAAYVTAFRWLSWGGRGKMWSRSI